MDFVLKLKKVYNTDLIWARDKIISVGFSSSNLKYNDGFMEDEDLSRRVEFRIITNAEEKINEILDIKGIETSTISSDLDTILLEQKKILFEKRAEELKQKEALDKLRKKIKPILTLFQKADYGITSAKHALQVNLKRSLDKKAIQKLST